MSTGARNPLACGAGFYRSAVVARASRVSAESFRTAVRIGVGAVVAGRLFDAGWHAAGPGDASLGYVAAGHGMSYAALVVVAVGAAYARFGLGVNRTAVLVVFLAALVALVGHALDLYAHATDASATLGHALFLAGEVVAVVTGVAITTEPSSERGR